MRQAVAPFRPTNVRDVLFPPNAPRVLTRSRFDLTDFVLEHADPCIDREHAKHTD